MGTGTLIQHRLKFRLNGVEHTLTSANPVTMDELSGMLYYTRRLIGYTLYPRWSLTRIFAAEVIETFKKQKIYRNELKKATNALIAELDSLEVRHAMEFEKDFIDIMVNSMSGKAMGKLNEFRGAMGGALMRGGMKNYVLCSYPYTLLNLCYDNICHYDQCMRQVKIRYTLDFSKVFVSLRGSKTYGLATKLLDAYLKATNDTMPKKLAHKDTGCVEKLDSLSHILLDAKNLHDAFMEAYEEMPDEKKALVNNAMNVWLDEERDEKNEIAKKLSQKYKVVN